MATMQVELEALPVPSATYIKTPPGRRQDGLKPKPEIKLTELPRATVIQLLEEQQGAVLKAWDLHQAVKDGFAEETQ